MLTTKFWKKYFKQYDILNQLIPYNSLLDSIVYNLQIKPGEKILDVGSGTGNLSIKLEREGAEVFGLDYSEEGIKIHKLKSSKAKILKHDITQKFPFEDETFDKICSNNVLYTISREKQILIFKEFHRLLKPGGIIVVSNLREGFRSLSIYREHIKEYKNIHGFISLVVHLISLIIPTIKIFYYNYLISRENKLGSYSFFKPDEQKKLLIDVGFSKVFDSEIHYARQAFLNKALK